MARSRARKKAIRRRRAYGKWWGMGPHVQPCDAVTGWPVPLRLTIEQRGFRVSKDYKDGARDRPDNW